MTQDRWSAVDDYLAGTLIREDTALQQARSSSSAAGLPEIQVPAGLGKLISMLAQIQDSRRILEIGTLGGYSTIWLARALPEGGTLISLELDPVHADVARKNVAQAGLGDKVEIRLGRAAESLEAMVAAGEAPFDFIFIDADKPGYPEYLAWSLKLSRPGTVIFADNVVRNGGIVDPNTTDPNVIGVRTMLDQIPSYDNLTATVIQSVGAKGYDGFALLRVS